MSAISVQEICSKSGLTPAEFTILLRNRTFLDFLNIFLSLPCFSLKVLCVFGQNDFIVGDAAQIKQKKRLPKFDNGKVGEWLLQHRIPLFLSSNLCLDMKLACELMDLQVYLNNGMHINFDDANKTTKVKKFIRSQIGHALGMCQLRTHMHNTAGEWLLDFWKDVELLRCLPISVSHSQRALKVHQIQIKYFNDENDISPIRHAWNKILDSTNEIRNEVSAVKLRCNIEEDIRPFETLQKLLMDCFKIYWLPRFILHRQKILARIDDYEQDNDSDVENSTSNISMSEVKNDIDENLNKLQPEARSELDLTETAEEEQEQEQVVDVSFLNSRDIVIVQHTTVLTSSLRLGSKGLQKELEQYDTSQPVTPSTLWFAGEEEETVISKASRRSLTSVDMNVLSKTVSGSDIRDFEREYAASDLSSLYNKWLKCSGSANAMLDALNFSRASQSSPESATKSRLLEGSRGSSTSLPNIDSPNQRRHYIATGSPTACKTMRSNTLPPVFAKHRQEFRSPHHEVNLYGCREPGIKLEEYASINTSENNFRQEHRNIYYSLIADSLSGGPFKKYLSITDLSSLADLHLFEDTVYHITLMVRHDLRIAKMTNDNNFGHKAKLFLADYRMLHRHAQLIISRYLLVTSPERVYLTSILRRALIAGLLEGDARDALLDTQDFLARHLFPVFKNFQKEDKNVFDYMMFSEDKASSRPGIAQYDFSHTSQSFDKKEKKRGPKLNAFKYRAQRALQLAAHMNNCDVSHCFLDPMDLENVIFDKNSREGSLYVDPTIDIKKRRDLVEHMNRMKVWVKLRWKKYQEKMKEMEVQEKLAQLDDLKLPEYARPIEVEGIRLQRPVQPRTFSDILRNQTQLKFFQQYLAVVRDETEQMSFWIEVESVKAIKDHRIRQAVVDKIFRKYFKDKDRFEAISNREDMMLEIQKKHRVTLQLLITAQSLIAGTFEALWFKEYQETFPQADPSESQAAGPVLSKIKPKRKTKPLWRAVWQSMTGFLRCLLNPENVREFKKFLRMEVDQEIERQRTSGNSAVSWSVPIKKNLYNKYLDMTKLLNDVDFLAEQERFRRLCDSLQMAAGVGIFQPSEYDILTSKAGTIVKCYIDSDINPKIQVNITTELADKILDDYKNGFMSRGLFHDASMSIYGVIMQLWRKYQTWKTEEMSKPKVQVTEKKAVIPDYFNIEEGQIKRIKGLSDGEVMLKFSLSQGLRWSMPGKGKSKNPYLTGNLGKLMEAFGSGERPKSKYYANMRSKADPTPQDSDDESDLPEISESKGSN